MSRRTNEKCFSTIKKVCAYWKIIGLCPFVVTDEGPGSLSYGAIFYTTMLIVAYMICYYYALIFGVSFIVPRGTAMTAVADFLAFSTEFLVIIAAWLYVILHRRQIQKIIDTFKNIQEKSMMLNVDQDFSKIFDTIKTHTIVINVMWFVLYTTDHVFLYDAETTILELWLPVNVPRVVTHNVALIYSEILLIVESFFSSLNEKIQRSSTKVEVRMMIPEEHRGSLDNNGLQSLVEPNLLETYVQMHSDLVALMKMIVNFFALSITLVLLLNLILTACDVYMLCLIVKDHAFSNWRQIAVFGELSCWSVLHLLEMFILIALSDSTVSEANRTGNVLHAMLVDDHTDKYVDSAQILSLRLLQRPLKIEFYGLFEMRFSVIHKIIGMMVTYITIMMQLDLQDQEDQEMRKRIT